MTTAALRAVRRVLDDDDEFRAAVAATTSEDAVGRAGWLFLVRPEGWEDELAALAAAEVESSEADRAAREERSAARRLRGAEEALRRTEGALAEARSQAARAAADLADERRSRRAAEGEAQAFADRLTVAERARADAVARAEALGIAVDRVAALEAALEEARRSRSPAVSAEEVLDVLAAAATAAQGLADTLAAAVASFGERPAPEPPSEVASLAAPRAAVVRPGPGPGPDPGTDPGPSIGPDPGPGPGRRRPVALPPAVRDDSVEAAEYLVRRPGALLLVDGYNASLRYRSDLPIPELRQRFVDALDELAARTGVDVHVVFDGASVGPRAGGVAGTSRRGRARVSFSPEDTEADDVILDLVDALPVGRAVVVASDDRRVRDGVEQRGGNVLSTRQLLAVLRREPDA